ncbi:hypothetical protein [Lichenicoccus sp.]|uniref:F0F1 ATP synthase subunit B family protein n=1 Tax=Lichenicoccus sp. TaxID=2781899 RepID=UPI003D0AB94D
MRGATGVNRRLAASTTAPLLAVGALLAVTASSARAAGMPQLDFRNPLTIWQVVWGAVIFLLLYLVLSRSALPRVASVLDARRSRIEGDLEAARSAKNGADRAIDDLRRARRRAAAEAQANIDRVLNDAREAAALRTREMNDRLEAEIAAAEAQLAQERTRAMGAMRVVAADTALLLVERVTGQPARRGLVEMRVDAALAGRTA